MNFRELREALRRYVDTPPRILIKEEDRFVFRRRPSMTSWDLDDEVHFNTFGRPYQILREREADLTVPEMIRAEEELARAQHREGAIDIEFEVVPEPKALIGDGK